MNITYYELSNYNSGVLIAKTFDLSGKTFEDHDLELQEWLIELTDSTGALCEEWIVADYEGIPSRYVSEWTINKEVFDYIELIEQGNISEDVINAGVELEIPLDKIEDAYQGCYRSNNEFAQEYIDSTGLLDAIPEKLQCYFDIDAFARNLMFDYNEQDGHYFSSHW